MTIKNMPEHERFVSDIIKYRSRGGYRTSGAINDAVSAMVGNIDNKNYHIVKAFVSSLRALSDAIDNAVEMEYEAFDLKMTEHMGAMREEI